MLNEVRLIGRLGTEPEIKTVNESSKVATLNIATWESYMKNDGNWETITEWHRVICWNKAAIACEKMGKGDLIIISGKLKNRSYDDKDGIKRYVTEVTGFARKMPKTEGKAPTAMGAAPEDTDTEPGDLPF